MATLSKSTLRAGLTALALAVASPALAAGAVTVEFEQQTWSFSGIFGQFDRAQLQRGFQVYKEVCSSCHSMELMSYRNLMQPGGPEFSEEQVRAIAAQYEVTDGPNDQGEMFNRPARLSDRFKSPFPNKEAAAVANNGKAPPDLSVIAKARTIYRGFPNFLTDAVTLYQETGPDYLYAFLTRYGTDEDNAHHKCDIAWNAVYHGTGSCVAMPNVVMDDVVTYQDGTPATKSQIAKDVTAFLMWTAEPKLEERKQLGFNALMFMIIFASLLYFTTKKLWRDIKH